MDCIRRSAILVVLVVLADIVDGFPVFGNLIAEKHHVTASSKETCLHSSTIDNASPVDPNTYNVDLVTATKLMTASVQQENSKVRDAGIPFIDVTSKDYFVDDVDVTVSRDGGMGIELLELAGGRDDGFGITIVTKVSGNAEKAGVVPGDSIAAVAVRSAKKDGMNVEETTRIATCECLDFDRTMDVLVNFPGDASEVALNLKRIRRWPKLKVTVAYPPIQVAGAQVLCHRARCTVRKDPIIDLGDRDDTATGRGQEYLVGFQKLLQRQLAAFGGQTCLG